jgi:hypothetical protein
VYVADTGNHRIVKVPPSRLAVPFGSLGSGAGFFNGPRDVAVAPDGELYVADTLNHRVVVHRADGGYDSLLAASPTFTSPQKVEVDALGQVFVIDSDAHRLVAFFSSGGTPYDIFLRDNATDTGAAPTPALAELASPDLLVRHRPDVNLATAAASGLSTYAFQQPRHGENNYVYVAVRNRGPSLATATSVRLYWADPSGSHAFPDDWHTDGFFESYTDASQNVPGHLLGASLVPGRQAVGSLTQDGVQVVGPILWRPPAPDAVTARDGVVHLLARLSNPHDVSTPSPGLDEVRKNNNIALRRVTVGVGPFPVGEQDTLVVRADLPGIGSSADETWVRERVDELTTWLAEASHGAATLKPTHYGPVPLRLSLDDYDNGERSPLVEMAEEVLNTVHGLDPRLLDGPTSDPADDLDRVILVLNDANYTSDWATTGSFSYSVGGRERRLSVSIQGPRNDLAQFAHGLSHQFGLGDLYPHKNVTFPGRTQLASRWDNMDEPHNGAHPLVWSKELATWVTASGARIEYIPRPARGTRYEGPAIALHHQSQLASGQTGAVLIGLTAGVTALEEETHFYVVEARTPTLNNADRVVPAEGVLVYYANRRIPQGHGPVLVVDHGTSTPDDLTDAVVPVGQSESIAGVGITVGVRGVLPGNTGFEVRVDYDPPPSDYNLFLRVGNPSWTSPDIWVDNQRDGNGYAATPTPGEEQPIGGEENRIYARVHNSGPADAYNVEVEFHLSAPYHTVGGEGAFDFYKKVLVPHVPAGGVTDVYVTWRPDGTGDPHNCVRVHLRRMTDDTNASDNEAQQNLSVINSSHGSPYDPFEFGFQMRNAFPDKRLIYFRAEGLPEKWEHKFGPRRRLMAPEELLTGVLLAQPHQEQPDCERRPIHVTAWTPQGDTLVQLGGATVNVGLTQRTHMKGGVTVAAEGACKEFDPWMREDRPEDGKKLYIPMAYDPENPPEKCVVLRMTGCTYPERPYQRVTVRYQEASSRQPVYHGVMTDKYGCFHDYRTVARGGLWDVSARYGGSKCGGPRQETFTLEVPLDKVEDQERDGLPDEHEVQGDADHDGIPNFLDWDSDGDGIPDGEEKEGDSDGDGIDDVVDPKTEKGSGFWKLFGG